jgi:uncharacterized protein
MANPGWTHPESPFHSGELAIQARFGAQERMDKQARRMVRDYLSEQHQQFFAQLSYVIVGTVDGAGSPWASMLVGNPGFLSSPNEHTLRVTAQPLFGDPLATTLAEGIDIGLLGIELHTRRRNRLNGNITAIHADSFDVHVGQSFGNCPQYIQSRMFELVESDPTSPKVHQFTTLGATERAIITAADTFFIATAYQDESAGAARGVDVSHRGGNPGFVRVDDDGTLTIPDFSGNCHFNTFGNLELNPRAGLLFVHFDSGDLLYLTGTAEVIWEETEAIKYEGAERLFRFRLDGAAAAGENRGYTIESSLPLRWSNPQFSPFLEHMGSW